MAQTSKNECDSRRIPALSTVLLQQLLAGVPAGVVFVDPRLCIVYANPRAAQMLGYPCSGSLTGLRLIDCLPPAAAPVVDQVRACLKTKRHQREKHFLASSPVENRELRISTLPLRGRNGQTAGAQISIEDLTEIHRIESQIRQAHGLESMGILAGGIARDFINILWEVMGNIELATAEIEVGHPARYNLELAETSCRSAQQLVLNILRFSRRSDQKRKVLRLTDIAVETIQELAADIPANVRIQHHLSTERDTILAEPSEIRQLLTHLYRNALQAMSDRGGILEVSVVDVALEAEELIDHAEMNPGRYVILTVMDTGPGLQPDLVGQVFEPFFSTKPPEQHTGLGLAIVKSIVRSHGGTVTMDSRPGKGTVVHVILPALHDSTRLRPGAKPPLPTGVGRILLVDSDPAVLEMRGRMVSRLGYEVEYADNSRQALELLANAPESFDLVLADQAMPDIPATVMARRIKQLREDLPVVLCTVMSGPDLAAEARAAGVDRLLLKPLRIKELAVVLREILPVISGRRRPPSPKG